MHRNKNLDEINNLTNENIIHVKKNNVEFIQFKKLLEYPNINHAYSLGLDTDFRTIKVNKKNDQNFKKMSEEKYSNAIQCYENLCNNYGKEKSNYLNLVKPNLTHSDNVKVVSEKINKEFPDFNLEIYKDTDGLITNKKDIILSTTNADCIIFIFYDTKNEVIANVHSGWRGTLKRISVKTIEKMKKEFGSNPSDIICCICPSIRKCHFEVNDDVKIPFEEEFKKEISSCNDKIIQRNKMDNNKWNIDTILLNKIILKNIGLKEENIIDSNICSVCNSNLIHSCRVEKEDYKLNTALIELK